jgi:hypothetical protein
MEHTVLLSVVTSAVFSVILARWWVQRMVVKAAQFILSDSKGRTRATLRVLGGVPTVNVFDEQGKCRAGWVTQKDGSVRVCFYDQNETATGMIRMGADGPTFAIEDADGRPRVELAVAPDGSPGMILSDPSGKPWIVLGAPDGAPSLTFFEKGGEKVLIVLGR